MPCSACAAWLVWPATLSTAAFVASVCSGCSAAGKNAGTARNISAARTDLMVDIGPAAFWGHPKSTVMAKARGKLPHREKFHKPFYGVVSVSQWRMERLKDFNG